MRSGPVAFSIPPQPGEREIEVCGRLVSEVLAMHGRLDYLVSNAGEVTERQERVSQGIAAFALGQEVIAALERDQPIPRISSRKGLPALRRRPVTGRRPPPSSWG